jgi:hypothetical protein
MELNNEPFGLLCISHSDFDKEKDMFRTAIAVLALIFLVGAFVAPARARPYDDYSNSSRGCMYNGYRCDEWGRPDSY